MSTEELERLHVIWQTGSDDAAADASNDIMEALPELVARVKRLEAALDPDETKHAYMGEFKNENGSYVSWTTIKEIMAAINARAALNQEPGQ